MKDTIGDLVKNLPFGSWMDSERLNIRSSLLFYGLLKTSDWLCSFPLIASETSLFLRLRAATYSFLA
jgi:hypothetical protein